MKNDISLNYLINHVIYTIDQHYKGQKAPKEVLEYLYLIAVGMILNYGENHINDIYDTIFDTTYMECNYYLNNRLINNVLYYKNPTSHNYLEKSINVKNSFAPLTYKYDILFDLIDDSPIKTLEYMTHEINFILFDRNKKLSIKDNFKFKFGYYNSNILLKDNLNNDYGIVRKILNVLQTEEIIKNILKLKKVKITSRKFKRILSKFNEYDEKSFKVEGLDILVNLFRPLYKNENTKKIFNSYEIDRNIEKEFDQVLGKNSYNSICKRIEILDSKILDCKKDFEKNYYEVSLEYLQIRNDFIQKYLNLKHAF